MNTTTIPTELARPEHVANAPARGLRSDLRIALQQIGFEQRAFWRNRTRAFFSVAFPLMFLVVFNAINSGDHISRLGGISYTTWFVPGILAYGIIMATFSNLAISTAIARDNGVLKRMRGTPIPTWVFMAGTIGSTLLTALLLVGCTLGLGAAAYGRHDSRHDPARAGLDARRSARSASPPWASRSPPRFQRRRRFRDRQRHRVLR